MDAGEDGKVLGELAFEASLGDLGAEDGIGLLKQGHLGGGDFADDADGQAWTGEGLAPDQCLGEAQLRSERANFVLEQVAQGFDELELQVVGQAADVVVALDDSGGAVDAAALDDVGVDGSLGEEVGVGDAGGLALEDTDEAFANDAALGFRIGEAAEGGKEIGGGVDGDELQVEAFSERGFDFGRFVGSQEAGVDKDGGEPAADGAGYEGGGDGAVDAAAEAADYVAVADLAANRGYAFVDDRGRNPVAAAAAHVDGEVAQETLAVGGVADLGMELNGDHAVVICISRTVQALVHC